MNNKNDRVVAVVLTVIVIWASVLSALYLPNLGIWQGLGLLIPIIFIALGSVVWIIYKNNQKR
jgi:hypothetical protein